MVSRPLGAPRGTAEVGKEELKETQSPCSHSWPGCRD
jgi:hypothetical protein